MKKSKSALEACGNILQSFADKENLLLEKDPHGCRGNKLEFRLEGSDGIEFSAHTLMRALQAETTYTATDAVNDGAGRDAWLAIGVFEGQVLITAYAEGDEEDFVVVRVALAAYKDRAELDVTLNELVSEAVCGRVREVIGDNPSDVVLLAVCDAMAGSVLAHKKRQAALYKAVATLRTPAKQHATRV